MGKVSRTYSASSRDRAVEVEVERVEAGAQVAAFLFVPDEGLAVVAEVAGEGGHVVSGIGEAEHVVADEGDGVDQGRVIRTLGIICSLDERASVFLEGSHAQSNKRSVFIQPLHGIVKLKLI